MHLELEQAREALPALVAGVGLLTQVHPLVFQEVALILEALLTHGAAVGQLPLMSLPMRSDLLQVPEAFSTLSTYIQFLSTVSTALRDPWVFLSLNSFSADRALLRLRCSLSPLLR